MTSADQGLPSWRPPWRRSWAEQHMLAAGLQAQSENPNYLTRRSTATVAGGPRVSGCTSLSLHHALALSQQGLRAPELRSLTHFWKDTLKH